MENSNKGLIFIGPAESGKSRTAREIAKVFGNQATYLNGRNYRRNQRFFFSHCTKETKVLVIDEITHSKYFEDFISCVNNNIIVDVRYKNPFELHIEKIIIIGYSEIKVADLSQNPSFQSRFSIIEFPKVSPAFVVNEISELMTNSKKSKQKLPYS